jgi:glycerophosphoryl diester phosphodiesterase
VGSHFDEKYQGERVPSLREVVTLLPKHIGIMAEIKCFEERETPPLEQIVDILDREFQAGRSVYIGSLTAQAVEKLQKLSPICPIMGIVNSIEDLENFTRLQVQHYALNKDILLLSEFNKSKLPAASTLWSWTVNTEEDIHLLLKKGVSGIISDNIATSKKAISTHISQGGLQIFSKDHDI